MTQPISQKSQVEVLLDNARNNYCAGKFDLTEELCLKVLNLNPTYLDNLLLLGAAYIAKEQYDKALECNEKALIVNGNCSEAYGNMANIFKVTGNIEKAFSFYKKALQINPEFIDAWKNLALAYVGQNDNVNAVECYKKVLAINPSLSDVRSDMGNLLKSLGNVQEAKECYEKTIELNPTFSTAWSNLGCVYSGEHNLTKALACFEKAVALDQGFLDAWLNMGNIAKDLKYNQKALKAYQKVLKLQPNHYIALASCSCVYLAVGNREMSTLMFNKAISINSQSPDTYSNLGNTLRELGRTEEAIEIYKKALQLNGNHADTLNNIGNAYKDIGNITKALESYERALLAHSNFPAAHSNFASVLKDMHRYDEAIAHYKIAIKIDPNFADAYSNMGNAMKDMGNVDEAIDLYKKAIALNPTFADAFSNLASAYKDKGLFLEAMENYEKALAIKPDFPDAVCNLAHCYRLVCNWTGWDKTIGQIKLVVDKQLEEGRTPSVQPHHLMLYPFDSDVVIKVAARHGQACIENAAGMKIDPFDFSVDDRKIGTKLEGRLRIGYVSSDFGNHPTAHLIQSVPGFHRRDRVEIFCYGLSADDNSVYRRKIENDAEHFVDISNLSTAAAAKKIYSDKIHILINLNGYTKGARNELFALRPAPIQVMWLGYPGTSGINFMDYMITDKHTCPPELSSSYSEKLVYIPNCYFVGDHRQSFSYMLEENYYQQESTVKREKYGLKDDSFVFCNFNQLYKIDSETFSVWMKILKAVPNSVLWLLQFPVIGEHNIRKAVEQAGVDKDRVVFSSVAPKDEHIHRGGLADVFLDTPLCNAHTTGTDILWSGIPMITMPRESFASRVATSLLHAMNCPELVCQDMQEYEELAIKLGKDDAYFKETKEKVKKGRNSAPLFDTKQTTYDLERCFFSIWYRREQNLEPDHIDNLVQTKPLVDLNDCVD